MNPSISAQATRDLNHACYHGLADLALQAIDDGADLGSCGSSGKRPLHFAAMGGNAALCSHLARLLPEAMLMRDSAGQTPLHLACRGGKADAAMALCSEGADTEALDDFGRRPVDCSTHEGLRRAMAEFERGRHACAWTLCAIGAALACIRSGDGL